MSAEVGLIGTNFLVNLGVNATALAGLGYFIQKSLHESKDASKEQKALITELVARTELLETRLYNTHDLLSAHVIDINKIQSDFARRVERQVDSLRELVVESIINKGDMSKIQMMLEGFSEGGKASAKLFRRHEAQIQKLQTHFTNITNELMLIQSKIPDEK